MYCKIHLYLTSLEHPIQLPHKQYSHSFFIAFRGGCCSTSQRENQLHGKILLKTLILKNRVRLDKEFGSFSFTIVFFAQILWRLISSTATIFSFWVRFDLCSFAPAERQKIKNGGKIQNEKSSLFHKKSQRKLRLQDFRSRIS